MYCLYFTIWNFSCSSNKRVGLVDVLHEITARQSGLHVELHCLLVQCRSSVHHQHCLLLLPSLDMVQNIHVTRLAMLGLYTFFVAIMNEGVKNVCKLILILIKCLKTSFNFLSSFSYWPFFIRCIFAPFLYNFCQYFKIFV